MEKAFEEELANDNLEVVNFTVDHIFLSMCLTARAWQDGSLGLDEIVIIEEMDVDEDGLIHFSAVKQPAPPKENLN